MIELGDVIQFLPTYRHASAWRGEFTVIGLRLDGSGDIDVTIAEGKDARDNWISPTDGFRPEHMIVLRRIPPSEWASIVASVSATGETSESYQKALNYHAGLAPNSSR